jgi:2-dehydro-3-deoxygluconokinase
VSGEELRVMPEVATIGETMVVFCPEQSGPLRHVDRFVKRIAGSESNVAIGLSRLGHSAGWISRLGRDELGEYVLREIRAEGIDVSCVVRVDQAQTGLMVKEIHEGRETRVYYYRRDSAASRMSPADLNQEYLAQCRFIHLSGVTPALSESCREMVNAAVTLAKAYGVKVSFDPNIRLRLWSVEEARETLLSLIPSVDVLFPGLEEGKILTGESDPDRIVDSFLSLGAKIVALKCGENGCLVADAHTRQWVAPFKVRRVVDPIGAGDAFAAGFLAGLLEGRSLEECGRMANAMGALAVITSGDFEGLPNRSEFDTFMSGQEVVPR